MESQSRLQISSGECQIADAAANAKQDNSGNGLHIVTILLDPWFAMLLVDNYLLVHFRNKLNLGLDAWVKQLGNLQSRLDRINHVGIAIEPVGADVVRTQTLVETGVVSTDLDNVATAHAVLGENIIHNVVDGLELRGHGAVSKNFIESVDIVDNGGLTSHADRLLRDFVINHKHITEAKGRGPRFCGRFDVVGFVIANCMDQRHN